MFMASRRLNLYRSFRSGIRFAPKGALENQDRSRAINIARLTALLLSLFVKYRLA
jgi:hypothetical protein